MVLSGAGLVLIMFANFKESLNSGLNGAQENQIQFLISCLKPLKAIEEEDIYEKRLEKQEY